MEVGSDVSPARICADCGREMLDSVVCAHCGGAPDDASAPSATDPDVAALAQQVGDLSERLSQIETLIVDLLVPPPLAPGETWQPPRLPPRRTTSQATPAESALPPAPEPADPAPAEQVAPAPPPAPAAREPEPAEAASEEPVAPSVPPAAAPPPDHGSAPPPVEQVDPPAPPPSPGEPEDVAAIAADVEPAAPAPPRPPRRVPPQRPPFDWERLVGRNWFAIIGAVALAIAAGFFLKLAFDNQWIGPAERVLLGVVAGLAMIGAGEYTARRAPPWSRAVVGGGISVLYLSIYASFGFFDLIPLVPALVFLGLAVALGGALSIRHNSRVVAFLALFGAFLTPALLGDDLGDRLYVGLGYLLVVDAGIVVVASVRGWRWYTLAGMVASYVLFAVWLDRIPPDETIGAQLGLSGVFLIFLGAATLYNILWRRKPNQFDMTLIMTNAFAFYGLTFGIMWEEYEPWFGLLTFLLAAFHGLVALGARLRPGVSPIVPLQLGATALIFLTVAAPLQFTGEWTSVAWAAEGAVVVGLGIITRNWLSRISGLLVLTCAVVRILALDTGSVDVAGFVPVLNGRFLAFAFGIAGLYAAAWLYGFRGGPAPPDYRPPQTTVLGFAVLFGELVKLFVAFEKRATRVLVTAANLMTLWIFSAEAISYFDRQTLEAVGSDAASRASHSLLSTLTSTWAGYGAILVAVARWRGGSFLALSGLTVVAVATLKLLLVDTLTIGIPEGSHTVVLNFYVLSFVFVMAGIATAAYEERRAGVFSRRLGFPVMTGLGIAAAVAVGWVLTAEIVRFFGNRELVEGGNYQIPAHLTLTSAWAAYGALLMVLARWRRAGGFAVGGLLVVAVAGGKFLLFDTFYVGIPEGSHLPVLNYYVLTFAFVMAGLATAAYAGKTSEAFMTGLGIAAALALGWVLTAEVVRFFGHRELVEGGSYQAPMHLTLTSAWALYGALLMAVAWWRSTRSIAVGGLAFVAVAAGKLLFFDTFFIGTPEGSHTIFLNFYFLTFAFVMVGIVTVAGLERLSGVYSQVLGRPVTMGLVVAANAVILWVVTAEVVRFFNHRELAQGGDFEAAMHLTLTLMWAGHAAFVISAGIFRGSRALRVMGIIMLAVPVAKLFLFDVFLLERGYRVGAFSILGVLLLAMGLAYQRYSATVKGLFRSDPAAVDAPESGLGD